MAVYVIAEAGVNHNGSIELAYELIDAAAAARADAVKFQTFVTDNLVTKTAAKAQYQKSKTNTFENQYDMLKKLELSHDDFIKLAMYSAERGIDFLSTAFDAESLTFLTEKLNLKTLKIPSGEITNAPFLLAHARTGCNLIISTGMADIEEITAALGVIAYGLLQPDTSIAPKPENFLDAFESKEAQKMLQDKVVLLHCTSEYPAPIQNVHLKFMHFLADTYNLKVGYSDHTSGIIVPIAACAMGAQVIEKHFTLDRTMEGPDHNASLTPYQLKELVDSLKTTEKSLGNRIKNMTKTELANKLIVRKSIVALTDINEGSTLTTQNIGLKRPGSGLSPYKYWEVLGTKATKTLKAGDLVE